MLRGTTSISHTRRLRPVGHSVADVFISLRCNGAHPCRSTHTRRSHGFLRQFHQTTSATFFWEGFQSTAFFPVRESIAYYF